MTVIKFQIGNTKQEHAYEVRWGEGKALMQLVEHLYLMAEHGRETTVRVKRGWTDEDGRVVADIEVPFSDFRNLGRSSGGEDSDRNHGYSESYRRMFTLWNESRVLEIHGKAPAA